MTDLDLRPERRDRLAADILRALQAAVPGSSARLRGSLAAGTADRYSDIDLDWIVPDESFGAAVESLSDSLSRGLASGQGPASGLASLRVDPDLARSRRRRLLYARLTGVPLFWRVDADVRAASVAANDRYDADNAAARSQAGWSRPGSAIENSIAAIKATVRSRPDVARGLLQRGFERIGQGLDRGWALPVASCRLADSCAALDPALTGLAGEVRDLADALLGEQDAGP